MICLLTPLFPPPHINTSNVVEIARGCFAFFDRYGGLYLQEILSPMGIYHQYHFVNKIYVGGGEKSSGRAKGTNMGSKRGVGGGNKK